MCGRQSCLINCYGGLNSLLHVPMYECRILARKKLKRGGGFEIKAYL